MSAWQRVTAITVTHNSAGVIASCLRAIAQAREIMVVDNASADDTVDIVQSTLPAARILKIDTNLGYGSAANVGLRAAETEFALLINPDAVLEPSALDHLVAAADRYPKAGILAPILVDAEGQLQRSHNAALALRESMPRKRNDPPPDGDLSASFLSGAVMLFRKRALDAVGLFDPAIFLYYEDDDLCLRMHHAGFSLILVADAKARHQGGASTGWSWAYFWRAFWHMGWSRLYYERKHRGQFAMLRLAAKLLARYALKILGDLIVFDRLKLVRDAARFCGTAGFLIGLPAH